MTQNGFWDEALCGLQKCCMGFAVGQSAPRGETPRVRLDAIMQVFSKKQCPLLVG